MTRDRLQIGLIGCGAISQYAHLPALAKARSARLTAICDRAEDLLTRIGQQMGIRRLYVDQQQLLADETVDAVLIAVPDAFHVPLATAALRAGKHVLVEKPLGANSAECRELAQLVKQTSLKLQVGSMKRYDPGLAFAHQFVRERLGGILSISGWYRDTLFRSGLQESLLPPLLSSNQYIKAAGNPKADKQDYSLVTHGAHLFDNFSYLGGRVTAVTVQMAHKFNQYSWHGLLEFEHGGLGHFELTVKVNSDWSEGYVIHGEGGSVEVQTFLPFYNRSSEVRAFDAKERQWLVPYRVDGNAYLRQLEAFAEAVLRDEPVSPNVEDGLAVVRLLEAVARSVATRSRIELEAPGLS